MASPWRNQIERDAWVERFCRVCHKQSEPCPILARADSGETPQEWRRKLMPTLGDTYKCAEFSVSPKPLPRRPVQQFEDIPLFNLEDLT